MPLKQINIRECHTFLLQIASAVDKLCCKHAIPYYMLGGTMLGAVRHKGFIPWDDDMDLGIPRPYYQQFIDLAKQELPEQFEIQEPLVRKAFVKVQLKDSLFVEELLELKNGDSYNGLAIDVFPLDGAADKHSFLGRFHSQVAFGLIQVLEGRFCSLKIRKGVKKVVAFLIKKIPLKDTWFSGCTDKWIRLFNYQKKNWIANFYGHWKAKEIVPKSVFGDPERYKFEDIELFGVSFPHEYLSGLYGDYMKIPPKEDREVHSSAVYLIVKEPQ